MGSVDGGFLERFYELFRWPEDPWGRGRERYLEALRDMDVLLDHRWFLDLVGEAERVRVLDLCGGTGVGGVALARRLRERGYGVELSILDLRGSALRVAERFCEEELGFRPRTLLMDALNLAELEEGFDVILLYGLSTPHFDPWEMGVLAWSAGRLLGGRGLFVVEESDRGWMLVRRGYRDVIVEGEGGRVLMSVHAGYDVYRGTARRLFLEVPGCGVLGSVDIYYWSLAGLASLLWSWFRDVDVVGLGGRRYFVLARGPRGGERPVLPGFLWGGRGSL